MAVYWPSWKGCYIFGPPGRT